MEFFKVEKNELNGAYMVHSDCDQLVDCFAFKGKAEATKAKDLLNVQALRDFKKFCPVLTWKNV